MRVFSNKLHIFLINLNLRKGRECVDLRLHGKEVGKCGLFHLFLAFGKRPKQASVSYIHLAAEKGLIA